MKFIKYDPSIFVKDDYYLFKTDATPKGWQVVEAYYSKVGNKMTCDIRNQTITHISNIPVNDI